MKGQKQQKRLNRKNSRAYKNKRNMNKMKG